MEESLDRVTFESVWLISALRELTTVFRIHQVHEYIYVRKDWDMHLLER